MAMLNDEKGLLSQGKPGTGTIMTSLIRQFEDGKKSNIDRAKALSVQEILGNIFVINFAGHDTTANTLAYAIFLLAAHPEAQDWMRDEIRALVGNQNSETWSYDDLFPNLKRTMAILVSVQAPSYSDQKYSQMYSLRRSASTLQLWRYQRRLTTSLKL